MLIVNVISTNKQYDNIFYFIWRHIYNCSWCFTTYYYSKYI